MPAANKSISSFADLKQNTGATHPEKDSKHSSNDAIKDDLTLLAPYLHYFKDLIYWKNPILSGLVLSGIFFAITLTQFVVSNFLSISCGFLFTFTFINLLYVGVARVIQSFSGSAARNPNSERIENTYFEWTEKNVIHSSKVLVTLLNTMARPMARLVLVQDIVYSIQASFVLYVLWSFVSYIPTTYVLIFSLFTLFSAPLAYQRNKAKIDSYKALVQSKTHKHFVQLCTFSAKIRKTLFEKVNQSKSALSTSPMNMKKEE